MQMMNINSIQPAPKPPDTSHLRTLANGAIYDMNKKRIVSNPGGGKYAITSETARDVQAIGQQKKRDALMRAANAVAAQGGGVDGRAMTGDYAFVEAIGEAMTMKALSVNDPKAVDAARFLFTETGISEKQAAAEQASASLGAFAEIVTALASFVTQANIVDGSVIPMRSDIEPVSDDGE